MESMELEIDVRAIEVEGQPTTHALIINRPFEYGYRLILDDLARAKMALALVESLPGIPKHDRAGEEGSIANLLAVGEDGMREYIDWHLEQHRAQAKNRAMNAAKKAGATDANDARDRVNTALGREQGDRSLLSPEEWDQAAEMLKKGVQA